MRRRYFAAVPAFALVGIVLAASPAQANHTRAHTCEQAAPPGGTAEYQQNNPSDPNDDRCIVRTAPSTVLVPFGPPQIDVGDPQPVGDPVVVTEEVVTNCKRVNSPNARKSVERCETQEVTTTTQQTEVTTTVTQPRREQRTAFATFFMYPFCGFFIPCQAGPLVNPIPLGPEVTFHPADPLVTTTTAPGPPIVDVDVVNTGTCTRNPGSGQGPNACPV